MSKEPLRIQIDTARPQAQSPAPSGSIGFGLTQIHEIVTLVAGTPLVLDTPRTVSKIVLKDGKQGNYYLEFEE